MRQLRARSLLTTALLAGILIGAAFLAAALDAADNDDERKASGLMVHVPMDGSFIDERNLGAVRPEADGDPVFVPGAVLEAALPAAGRPEVGRLHVTRLSRLLLRGRTPKAGTIMLWYRPAPTRAEADSTAVSITILRSDEPLRLAVTLGGEPLSMRAEFADRGSQRRSVTAAVPARSPNTAATSPWLHVALGWDSEAGTVTAFIDGKPVAEERSAPFAMPDLPQAFMLGAEGAAIDDFRLYDNLLSPEQIAALPGLAGASGDTGAAQR